MRSPRSRVLWLAAVLILGVQIAATLQRSDAPQVPAISRETSPGGIDYLRIAIAGSHDVRLNLVWAGDLEFTPLANQDVATVASRLMLTGGAEGISAGEAHEEMDDLQADARLNLSSLFAWLRLDVPLRNLDPAVRLINAHLRAPAMQANWFNRVRAQVAADNRENRASPEWLAHEALRHAVIRDDTVRRSLAGEAPENVMRITPDDVSAWRQAVMTRHPLQVIIAGSIGQQEAGAAVDGLFKGVPAAHAEPHAREAAADFRPRRILLHMPGAQTSRLILAGALPAADTRSEDTVILEALAGTGGVLFETARSEMRAAYGFDWSVSNPTDTIRFFRLEGEIETAKLAAAEAALRNRYAKFLADAGPLHIDEAKARLLSDLVAAQDDPGKAVDQAFAAWSTHRDLSMLTDPSGFLAGLDAQSVASRLRQAFPRAEGLVVIAVSPDAGALPAACLITAPEQAAACR